MYPEKETPRFLPLDVMKCIGCAHPIPEHSRYIGCMVVIEPGRAGRDEEGRDDVTDVFCACPISGTLEDAEDDEEDA